jgi:hypothetical protein
MTYSINTSKYTAKKAVEINGTLFKVRPTTTDEQFTITELQQEAERLVANKADVKDLKKVYDKTLDIYFSLFDKPEKIREILKEIPADKIVEIHNDIMENAQNAED